MNEKIRFEELLERAMRVAITASNEGVKPAQISNLDGVLETRRGLEGVNLLLAHIIRQPARPGKPIGRKTAALLCKDIRDIMSRQASPDEVREDVRIYLGLIKWLHDPLDKLGENEKQKFRGVKSFEGYVKAFTEIYGGRE